MNELFTTYAGYPVREIAGPTLRDMIQLMIADADYVMGAQMDEGEAVKLIRWTIEFLYEKYGYLPFNHVRGAVKAGSVRQRGGTSKLIPRNIGIWLWEQDKIFQEQSVADHRKKDEIRRTDEMKGFKSDGLVATAVRIKVDWLADGRITGDQYDSFSSEKIYNLLKTGRSEKDIYPREVVPNYDEKR